MKLSSCGTAMTIARCSSHPLILGFQRLRPAISNLRAFASSTNDAVLRFATDIWSTTARNAKFADYPTRVAAPRAGNTAFHANHADIPSSPPAATPCTDNRIAAILEAALLDAANAAITTNAACAAISAGAAIISTATTESASSSQLDSLPEMSETLPR